MKRKRSKKTYMETNTRNKRKYKRESEQIEGIKSKEYITKE